MTRKLCIDTTHDFQFTHNWFLNRNLSTFREFVLPEWADKPITYLEIGVFEGQSMVWMLQRVLTHPDARAVGVDPWLMTRKLDDDVMYDVWRRALHNQEPYQQCGLWRANSAEFLRRCLGKGGFAGISKNSLDLCMIDGDHNECAVLDDARNVLQLLRPGGWMLFDDVENRVTKQGHVKHGVTAFLEEHSSDVELIWKDNFMECYKKR